MVFSLGLVGLGKIARDQHLPAIEANADFSLRAIASRNATFGGVANFPGIAELVASASVTAVTFCTPPAGRYEQARLALEAGLHVMLEKPPGATLTEVEALVKLAEERGLSLFASWHSRMAPAVAPAREWLAGRAIRSVAIRWREDIRKWHPGQEWILGPGGFGVFDPAINGLSIATAILPHPLIVSGGMLEYPQGRASPIRGELSMRCGSAPVSVSLDFEEVDNPEWTIAIETDAGKLLIEDGGAQLTTPDGPVAIGPDAEYPALYARFAELIAAGKSDVDLAPLRIVADALLLADREVGPPFAF